MGREMPYASLVSDASNLSTESRKSVHCNPIGTSSERKKTSEMNGTLAGFFMLLSSRVDKILQVIANKGGGY